MGAWGSGPFENDEAVDWLCSLEKFLTLTVDHVHGPRIDKGDSGIDEKIAAIEVVTMLELKPNATKTGSCPLGYKFPNDRIINSCLESIEEMRKQIERKEYWHDNPPIELLDKLQDKLEIIKNKLLMEHL